MPPFPKYKLMAIGAIAFVFVLGIGAYFAIKPKPPKTSKCAAVINLDFWSVFDDSRAYETIIDGFQRLPENFIPPNNPASKGQVCTTVNYRRFNIEDYEAQLREAFASGRGPDIFSIHHTWVARYQPRIAPATQQDFDIAGFIAASVPVVATDFLRGPSLYGVPLSVDTLALYYNDDMFREVSLTRAPADWTEFQQMVERLARVDKNGNILRAGAAIGTAKNVNRAADILALLMMQSGSQMVTPDGRSATFASAMTADGKSFSPGARALEFYTAFADPRKKFYTWGFSQDWSLDAFGASKVAMMFNYSYHIATIRRKNPNLRFSIAPMPQIKQAIETGQEVNYPNYWANTVSTSAQQRGAAAWKKAWEFLSYSSQPNAALQYLGETRKPASRKDLVTAQLNDPDLKVFARQAQTARSWYQYDSQAVLEILSNAIDSVAKGGAGSLDAAIRAQEEVTLTLRR